MVGTEWSLRIAQMERTDSPRQQLATRGGCKNELELSQGGLSNLSPNPSVIARGGWSARTTRPGGPRAKATGQTTPQAALPPAMGYSGYEQTGQR